MRKYRGVSGGTVFGEPLCRTCRYAHYIQGKAEGQLILLCGLLSTGSDILPWEAYDCNKYNDKRLPEESDMRQTAWLISTDKLTKSIGFHAPGTKRHAHLSNKEGHYTNSDEE